LIATGPILGRANAAADLLAERGISASVVSFPAISPLDEESVISLAASHRALLTIEEHSANGGFGSRIADLLMISGTPVRFGKYGTTDALRGKVGSQSYLLDLLPAIADRAAALL
jgi:transketolase